MKLLKDLNALTRAQLIRRVVSLYNMDNLIQAIKQVGEDKDFTVVLVADNDNSFISGKSDDICNVMFYMIEQLIVDSGLKFDVIIQQILDKRKKNEE